MVVITVIHSGVMRGSHWRNDLSYQGHSARKTESQGKDHLGAIPSIPLARDLFERRGMDQGASSKGLELGIYFEVGGSRI